MNRWWWFVVLVALLGVGAVAFVGRAMLGDYTAVCSTEEARVTMNAARFDTESLTILTACTEVVTGLRSGTTREVVVVGTEEAVFDALHSAGVDLAQASASYDQETVAPDLLILSGHSPEPPCREDSYLGLKDEIEFQNRPWDRHLTWCETYSGEGSMVGIILETGSL